MNPGKKDPRNSFPRKKIPVKVSGKKVPGKKVPGRVFHTVSCMWDGTVSVEYFVCVCVWSRRVESIDRNFKKFQLPSVACERKGNECI